VGLSVVYPMAGTHDARQWSRRVVTVMGMVVVGGELCLCLGLVTRHKHNL